MVPALGETMNKRHAECQDNSVPLLVVTGAVAKPGISRLRTRPSNLLWNWSVTLQGYFWGGRGCIALEAMLFVPTALAFSNAALSFPHILISFNPTEKPGIYDCWLQHAFLGDFMAGKHPPVKNN